MTVMMLIMVLMVLSIPPSQGSPTVNILDDRKGEFMWGVATAAYQIEGATEADGRGPSIWDEFTKLPNKVANNENADVADLSYYKYVDDIVLMKSLGVKYYRFSISWSRIFPQGKGQVNSAGIHHYNSLIDSLVDAEIEPVVTLYHWDLPQGLEDDYDGWLGDQIVQDFVAYADTCFSLFGDRVKIWITLNEPWTFILNGYVSGVFAPGRCSDRSRCVKGNSETEGYIAAHNALKAHAAAVQLYRKEYAVGGGVIGITLNIDWAYPLDNAAPEDIAAAKRRNEFTFSWFADPIFFGKYPTSMQTLVQGRLPRFTGDEVNVLKGSTDFIGLNHYSSWYLSQGVSDGVGWFKDQQTISSKYDLNGNLIGPQGGSIWLNKVPEGIYDTLMWIDRRYNHPTILITENGCDIIDEDEPRSFDAKYFTVHDESASGNKQRRREDESGEYTSLEEMLNDETGETKSLLTDSYRVEYLREYLSNVQSAMHDGVDVRGYFAWSLLDNFEWADGFSKRFGLFRVNYTDPHRHRSPKSSAFFYREYITQHSMPRSSKGEAKMRRRKYQEGSDMASSFSYLRQASEYFFQNTTAFERLGSTISVP